MPPRKEKTSKKEKLSKPNLRDLIRGHGIEFKDSLLPQEWPTQYKHHFQTVRDIAAVRYDDYKKDKMVPKQHWQHFQENIERIIHIACQFSNEEANEPTWRWLEGDILKRFNTRVICKRCEHDLWKADYEAHSHNKEDDAELQRKRMKRQLCGCKDGRPIPKTENDDDENHPCLFTFADDRPVTHTPGDNLQGLSISMKPDCVYGLLAPSKLRNSSSEFPVLERRILLPFLVVEAKRANGAPGFRAIQNQTAFPIRRLLKAQDALYSLGSTREPTLVWFFAYQGELWQLHAAIYKDNKVKIYDLWLGTIKSHDGCLQLLLLVDFIWSWARDIYRPNIMDLLLISDPTLRDFSPASTDRVRESVSVFSARMPTPAPPLLGSRQSLPLHSGRNPTPSGFTSAQADPRVLETEDVQGTIPLIEDFEQIDADPEEVIVVDDSDLDSYLRWAVDYKFAPPWTKVGSIRYSNIVRFEFRCIDLVWDANVTAEDQEQGDIFRKLYESAFWISRDQLYELVALWTDPDPVLTHYGRYLSVPMIVTLLLQTYCDRSTWQIKRVLTCFVWQLQEGLSCTVPLSDLPVRRLMDGTIEYANLEHLRHNIEDVRQICGRDSVWFAFRSIGMILSLGDECKSPRWIEFQQFGLPEHFQDLLDGVQEWSRAGNIYIADVYTCGSVSLVDPKYERRPSSTIPDLEPDTRNGNSMLVIGSPSRPQVCPQFCLFVLEENTHDGGELYQLLEEAITQKNFYCQYGVRKFCESDWKTLRGWKNKLSKMKEKR